MATQTPITLTGRDYDSNRRALVDYIRSVAPDLWNSFNDGDLGTVLLDVIAYDASILTYIADSQFRESFLDTATREESLRHFCRLTGYQPRRNSAASVEAMVEVSVAPEAPEYLLLRKGTKVRSKDGLPWEVVEDYRVMPGFLTPVRRVTGYGDIRARSESGGLEVMVEALVKIRQGEALAVLVDPQGRRLPSEFNFGPLVGPGHVLKLTSQLVSSSFGPAPDSTRREFVVTGVDKLEFDRYPGGVLYLDRPWDLADYTGKWEIENRSIQLVQGESREDRVVGPSGDEARSYRLSTAFYPVVSGASEPYLVAGLLATPAVESGVVVTVNGVEWRQTASLLFEGPSDAACEIGFDHVDRAVVKFGNGINGSVLPPAAEITIRYRTGGGLAGNVTQGSFDTSIPGTLVPAGGTSPTVFVTNPYTVGSGGRDRESLSDIKRNVADFVRTNDRAVTAEDYAFLASNFSDPAAGRIARAIGVLHQNAVPREQNIVWVYAWADRGTGQLSAPSLPLKRALHQFLDSRRMVADEVVVVDGVSLRIPLVFQYRYSKAHEQWAMEERLRTAMATIFAAQTPGQDLLLSRIYEAMEAVPGLEMCLVASPATNFTPNRAVELYVNSATEPRSTHLLVAAAAGTSSVVVSDPSIFHAGGIVTLWQPGCTPTSGEVESVSGSVVTLKRDVTLADAYTVRDAAGRGATVYNSDYVGIGWQYQRPVTVHVRYSTSSSGVEAIDRALAFKIRAWFKDTLMPEAPVRKAALEYLVATTSGVVDYQIDLGSLDSSLEVVTASLRERLVIGALTINGITY